MKAPTTRADARRSRRLLIDAGTAALAEHGIDVQVSEITRRAGLAKGTFFRHFPSKRSLLIAILVESVQRQTAIAKALIAQPTTDLLYGYMTSSAADIAPLRAVIESAILHGIEDDSIRTAMNEHLQALDQLLAEAKACGEIRTDVTALDIHTLVFAATNSSAHFFFRDYPEIWRRYLSITLDGLRPAAANPLPVSAPDLSESSPRGQRPGHDRQPREP